MNSAPIKSDTPVEHAGDAAAAQPPQPKREPNRGGRREQRRGPHRPAPVARIDEARSRRAAQQPARNDDGDASHLPAFLLRPVPQKA